MFGYIVLCVLRFLDLYQYDVEVVDLPISKALCRATRFIRGRLGSSGRLQTLGGGLQAVGGGAWIGLGLQKEDSRIVLRVAAASEVHHAAIYQ